jgi:hypothetical protein
MSESIDVIWPRRVRPAFQGVARDSYDSDDSDPELIALLGRELIEALKALRVRVYGWRYVLSTRPSLFCWEEIVVRVIAVDCLRCSRRYRMYEDELERCQHCERYDEDLREDAAAGGRLT